MQFSATSSTERLAARVAEPRTDFREPSVRVPIYGARLGAGTTGGEPSDEIVAYGNVWVNWLRNQARVDPGRAFIAQVLGHSMKNLFYNGDLVIGEAAEEMGNDDTYAFHWDGEVLIKHIRRYRDHMELVSENPSFGPIVVSTHELDRFKLIGRIAGRVTGHIF